MDQTRMDLRQRSIEKATEFIRAQRIYIEANNPSSRKSNAELKEVTEEYLKAAAPYEAALQELHQYLLAAEPSEAIASEIERTEQLLDALDKEKRVASGLIAHQGGA